MKKKLSHRKLDLARVPEGYVFNGRLSLAHQKCRHSWEYWADRMRCVHCRLLVHKVKQGRAPILSCVQCKEQVLDRDNIGVMAGLVFPLHESCFWDYTADWDDYQRQRVIDRFTDASLKYRVADRAALDEDLQQQLSLARFALRESRHRAYKSREKVRKARDLRRNHHA